MYTFNDYYTNTVELSFEDHPYSHTPKHVWVICRYGEKWLLTHHSHRGLEFPGGKIEPGETAEEAAIREVKEETGGDISALFYIGQYRVTGRDRKIVKNVYFGLVDKLEKQDDYLETRGPVLFDELPKNIRRDRRFSFMMRDDVLQYSLERIEKMNIRE